MRYSFFHAADLHLGAASEGVMRGAPARIREAVERSTYLAFDKLISDIERDRPAFVVFPGDLYNASDDNLKARLAFRDGMRRLHALGVPSFVIRGNHDPFLGKDPLLLPDSCHVFEPSCKEHVTVSLDGQPIARIFGQSYPAPRVTKNLAAGYPLVMRGEDGLLQVALLHGNLDGEKNLGSGEKNARDYAPFTLQDLEDRGYDYWALGHVHGHRILSKGASWSVYTGTLQGISPRERGPKGYVVVSVANCSIEKISFQESDVLRWDEIEVDLTGVETFDSVVDRIDRHVRASLEEAEGRPVVGRLKLIGATALNEELRKEDFSAQVESIREGYAAEDPFFWLDDCAVETKAEIDWQAIRGSHSVAGFLLELSEGGSRPFIESLPARLKDLAGRSRFEVPSDEEIAAALQRAGERAVSLLNLGADA